MTKKSEDTEVKKINSIRVTAKWNGFSPDCRPYKPSTPQILFEPMLFIVVDVPLQPDLIDNASVISMAQLANQTAPNPNFTPLGMRYIIDQFEAVMKNGEPEKEEKTSDDEDWDEGEEETKKETSKPIKKSDDEDWDDEEETEENDEDKPWEEDWEG